LMVVLSELGVGSLGHDQNPGRTPPTNLRTLGVQDYEPMWNGISS
jgi:hypothetical protein